MSNNVNVAVIKDDLTAKNPISGFWRRVAAFIIDCVIVGLFGLLLGALFGRLFAQLGSLGPLVGYLVIVAYFGILDSRKGKGQSLGKRFLHICVVNGEGVYLSPGRALSRAAILTAPLCLNALPLTNLSITAQTIFGLFILVVYAAFVYFYVFNSNTRQSLHDLLTGAFVIKSDAANKLIELGISSKHYTIFPVIALLIFSSGYYLHTKLLNENSFVPIMSLQKELLKIEGIDKASILVSNITRLNDKNEILQLNVTVYRHGQTNSVDNMEKSIENTIFEQFPLLYDMSVVNIRIISGYDIGISRNQQTVTTVFSPQNPSDKIRIVEKRVSSLVFDFTATTR